MWIRKKHTHTQRRKEMTLLHIELILETRVCLFVPLFYTIILADFVVVDDEWRRMTNIVIINAWNAQWFRCDAMRIANWQLQNVLFACVRIIHCACVSHSIEVSITDDCSSQMNHHKFMDWLFSGCLGVYCSLQKIWRLYRFILRQKTRIQALVWSMFNEKLWK